MSPLPSTRRLLSPDLPDYRRLRLEALASNPGNFASSLERETAMTDQEWLHRLEHPDSAIFGLYMKSEIVGITGVVVDKANPEQAILVQSYLRPAYRGRGLSSLLYEARIAWARDRGLRRLVNAHRADNLASRAAMLSHGFLPTHTEPFHWPDGADVELCHYALDL